MKKALAGGAIAAFAAVALAAPAHADPPDCNWGMLTAGAIAEGFEQGPHASGEPTPRAGLANLDPDATGRDKLQFTCELIDGLLDDE
jgi:hypothetical protein